MTTKNSKKTIVYTCVVIPVAVANGIIGTMLCNDSSGTENVTTPYVQSNSQKLLAAIVSMKPNSPLKRDMIAAASARLREIESHSNNSYNMPNLNSP